MAKFYGTIGYGIATESETSPGVWVDTITEVDYTGDVIRNSRNWQSNESVNPDLTISDTISIIADEFMVANIALMKYVKWRGATWAISNVVVERPRVIFGIGGLYNGPVKSS